MWRPDPEWNFRVSGVEALAARVLKDSDPELANRSLVIAEEDWKYAAEGLNTAAPLAEVYGAQDELERISFGVVASVELYLATGDDRYAQEAIVLGDLVLSSQERTLQPWTIPLTGFFYTSPKRENLFHRFHIGQEQESIVALIRLCEAFPDHEKWMCLPPCKERPILRAGRVPRTKEWSGDNRACKFVSWRIQSSFA